MLTPGLYEQVINNALGSELAEIPEARKETAPTDKAEASQIFRQIRGFGAHLGWVRDCGGL